MVPRNTFQLHPLIAIKEKYFSTHYIHNWKNEWLYIKKEQEGQFNAQHISHPLTKTIHTIFRLKNLLTVSPENPHPS